MREVKRLVYRPPRCIKPYIGKDTDTEEYCVRKGYGVKRIRDRYGNGNVFVFKYNADNIGIEIKHYRTTARKDKEMYDALSITLQNSTFENFEANVRNMLLTEDIRPYIKVEKG